MAADSPTRLELWLKADKDLDSRKQIIELAEQSQEGNDVAIKRLRELLEVDISFGTAGLRATMGPGFSRMNNVTVQLATQGVTEYLLEHGGKNGVVVGHDHRHHSDEFARITEAVLTKKGLKVYSFGRIVPTPFVPFAVRLEGADFGIMITASHNPASDNGYKVYNSNACQIMFPIDRKIATLITNQKHNLWEIDLSTSWLDVDQSRFYDKVLAAYISSNLRLFDSLRDKRVSLARPKIAYTPMHGVGYEAVAMTLRPFGFDLLPVPSQVKPDPDFPTCSFPNPEEGMAAYKEAFAFSDQEGIKFIFANDPDADRFNLAEFDDERGDWKIFTGNEIAVMFADFLWTHRQLMAPDSTTFFVVNSCVSSKLLKSMGQKEGFQVVETLTGFKYLANASQQLEMRQMGHKVLLAYEEAIGYMVNTDVWDKDGISALLLACFMLIDCQSQGISLVSYLDRIYQKYGYFIQYNSYYFGNVLGFGKIFGEVRNKLHQLIPGSNVSDLTCPCHLLPFPNVKILSIKDYPGTNMITLYLDEDELSWITFRASGTEPKIKFYSEIKSTREQQDETAEELRRVTNKVCEWLLEPSVNGLLIQGSRT